MFENIFSMVGNYEDRKVGRFDDEATGLVVSTARVSDSDRPYETAIGHPGYNDGKYVIVEMYDTHEEAEAGHARWVGAMTGGDLPKSLRDVSEAEIAKLVDAASPEDGWREFPLTEGGDA
jgi:hypothetical protein